MQLQRIVYEEYCQIFSNHNAVAKKYLYGRASKHCSPTLHLQRNICMERSQNIVHPYCICKEILMQIIVKIMSTKTAVAKKYLCGILSKYCQPKVHLQRIVFEEFCQNIFHQHCSCKEMVVQNSVKINLQNRPPTLVRTNALCFMIKCKIKH